MSSSGNRVSWPRSKDHTKRQTQRVIDEDFYLHESSIKHSELHKTAKDKADKHLSNLHLLLGNIPNFKGNDLMTSKNFAKFNEKVNASSFNGNSRHKTNKSG